MVQYAGAAATEGKLKNKNNMYKLWNSNEYLMIPQYTAYLVTVWWHCTEAEWTVWPSWLLPGNYTRCFSIWMQPNRDLFILLLLFGAKRASKDHSLNSGFILPANPLPQYYNCLLGAEFLQQCCQKNLSWWGLYSPKLFYFPDANSVFFFCLHSVLWTVTNLMKW